MGTEVFWIRLICAEFEDPRWLAIEQMPDADAVQIIYIRMLMLAGRSNADGLLLLHESLPYDAGTLAAVLRRTVPVVQFALATLEKFRFIEMVDNVIAITAWDKLQSTSELAKIADRREKDKIRKREERSAKKNLLLASAEMSVDCPRTSVTTKKESKFEIITTPTAPVDAENVVVNGTAKFEEQLQTLIPASETNKRLLKVIGDAVSQVGEEVTLSNIRYAVAHHDPSKGKLGGMICAAIENDYACTNREEARSEEETRAAARARRENAEAAKREEEERDRKEMLAQQAVWLSLSLEDKTELARQAQDKLACLPISTTGPLESELANTDAPITKILAAMFSNGELSLHSGRGESANECLNC